MIHSTMRSRMRAESESGIDNIGGLLLPEGLDLQRELPLDGLHGNQSPVHEALPPSTEVPFGALTGRGLSPVGCHRASSSPRTVRCLPSGCSTVTSWRMTSSRFTAVTHIAGVSAPATAGAARSEERRVGK